MNRFAQLEFGDRPERDPAAPDGEAPRDEHFFHRRALEAFLVGDFEASLRNESRALEHNSTFLDAWAGQVWMLIELGEYPEAALWTEKALALFPEHPELLAALAVAHLRDEHFDKALAYADNAVSRDNPTPSVWLARAEVLLARRRPTAEACLRNAVAIGGANKPLVQLLAGRLLQRYREPLLALEHLEAAAAALARAPLVWYELGRCRQALKQRRAAGDCFRNALKLRPDWSQARQALALVERRGLLSRLWSRP